jgi:hypothetical protein
MFSRGDRFADPFDAAAGDLRIEINRVRRIIERGVDIGGVTDARAHRGEFLQLLFIAPDENRLGHEGFATGDLDPPLFANCEDRANEVLVGPHSPRNTIEDQADVHLIFDCRLPIAN